MTRRELLGAVALWSVPTVVSLTLGVRSAYAAASCPPCTEKVGNVCRACSIRKILNCGCEPCLGPPYCSSGSAAYVPDRGARSSDPGAALSDEELFSLIRRRTVTGRPSSMGARADSVFGAGRRWQPGGRAVTPGLGRDPELSPAARSLYERLRTFEGRRTP